MSKSRLGPVSKMARGRSHQSGQRPFLAWLMTPGSRGKPQPALGEPQTTDSGTNAVLPASLAPLSHTGLPAVHPECQAHTCPGSFALAGHFRAARPLHLPTASSSFRSPVRCPLLREAAHTVPAGTATFAHPWSCALRHPHFVPFTAQPTMACEPKPAHSLLLYSP